MKQNIYFEQIRDEGEGVRSPRTLTLTLGIPESEAVPGIVGTRSMLIRPLL